MKLLRTLLQPSTLLAAGSATAALWVALSWLSPAAAQSTAALPMAEQVPLRIEGSAGVVAEVAAHYRFTPHVVGKNIRVNWTITNKPSWAKFDAASGTLYGTPQADHLGLTDEIVISASDGATTLTLPGFRLRVVPDTHCITAPTLAASVISA